MAAQGGSEPQYEVVSPVPAQRVAPPEVAERLGTLSGKTVAFLWDSLFDGDLCFEAIAAELSRHYPEVTFVGYEAFGDIHGRHERAVVADLPDKLARYRVDAAIVGVGA
jgi:hypothetical protein